jgi:hypothetical protein
MNIWLPIIGISFMALGLSNLLHYKSVKEKYAKGNILLDLSLFFKTDAAYSILGSILTVGIFMVLLQPLAVKYPNILQADFVFTLLGFATTAYFGSDIAVRLFSVVNKRYNEAIDYKTDIADKQTGNLGKPTPAEKPANDQPQ